MLQDAEKLAKMLRNNSTLANATVTCERDAATRQVQKLEGAARVRFTQQAKDIRQHAADLKERDRQHDIVDHKMQTDHAAAMSHAAAESDLLRSQLGSLQRREAQQAADAAEQRSACEAAQLMCRTTREAQAEETKLHAAAMSKMDETHAAAVRQLMLNSTTAAVLAASEINKIRSSVEAMRESAAGQASDLQAEVMAARRSVAAQQIELAQAHVDVRSAREVTTIEVGKLTDLTAKFCLQRQLMESQEALHAAGQMTHAAKEEELVKLTKKFETQGAQLVQQRQQLEQQESQLGLKERQAEQQAKQLAQQAKQLEQQEIQLKHQKMQPEQQEEAMLQRSTELATARQKLRKRSQQAELRSRGRAQKRRLAVAGAVVKGDKAEDAIEVSSSEDENEDE